jgi:hypothetical protein
VAAGSPDATTHTVDEWVKKETAVVGVVLGWMNGVDGVVEISSCVTLALLSL